MYKAKAEDGKTKRNMTSEEQLHLEREWILFHTRLSPNGTEYSVYDTNIPGRLVSNILSAADRRSHWKREVQRFRVYHSDCLVMESKVLDAMDVPPQHSSVHRSSPHRVIKSVPVRCNEITYRKLVCTDFNRQVLPYSAFPSDLTAIRQVSDVIRYKYTVDEMATLSIEHSIQLVLPTNPVQNVKHHQSQRIVSRVFITEKKTKSSTGESEDFDVSSEIMKFLDETCEGL